MKHSHYKKDVTHLRFVDPYRVCDLFGVTNSAVAHAVKKLLCAGYRGSKSFEQDLREAGDSIDRALQMLAENDNVGSVPALHQECPYPPDGWRCTRAAGHDGPCAAVPVQVGVLSRVSSTLGKLSAMVTGNHKERLAETKLTVDVKVDPCADLLLKVGGVLYERNVHDSVKVQRLYALLNSTEFNVDAQVRSNEAAAAQGIDNVQDQK